MRLTSLTPVYHVIKSRRYAYAPSGQRRAFFGLGEIIGVISNPAETLRQINESKQMLKDAKEELQNTHEQRRIPRKHTFSKLPGFHGRKHEQTLLRRILNSDPALTLLFGGTSVGKTALLRQVLTGDEFFVVNMDLRISGFANTRTLFVSLAEQFERFFDSMDHEEMHRHALTFKHMHLSLLERDEKTNYTYEVSAADIAALMEAFQSCLLGYWEFDPEVQNENDANTVGDNDDKVRKQKAPRERTRQLSRIDGATTRSTKGEHNEQRPEGSSATVPQEKPWRKRSVVFVLDEAHKLPALIKDELVQKVLLDSLLVLTKQDRLCHVLLTTSDSFFHHYLRAMNVSHHAAVVTIGDCDKTAVYDFFFDELVTKVPADLRPKVDFDGIYDVFGGKLAHISDYLNAWIQSQGTLTPLTSAIFLQAYTLIQVHLSNDSFQTWSSLPDTYPRPPAEDSNGSGDIAGSNTSSRLFTRSQLLELMRILVQAPHSIPYFDLCRRFGQAAVDAMIRTRIVELRWTDPVTPEDHTAAGPHAPWQLDGVIRPLILPMTRVLRVAMQVILNEEEYFEIKTHEMKALTEDI
ncbi:hypothetical protein PYCC9005_001930 [Savitreella phatthalungensis]